MYFKNFNYINYDYTLRGETPIIETIVDLMARVNMTITKEDLAKMSDEYSIPSGMKPEHIAATIYGNPLYHWTILYVNNITDIHTEWPMDEVSLLGYVTRKYGEGNENGTHHYEKMPERLEIDPDFCTEVYGDDARLVSNYDYEYELNEMKRQIIVIKPAYIGVFIEEFKKAMVV